MSVGRLRVQLVVACVLGVFACGPTPSSSDAGSAGGSAGGDAVTGGGAAAGGSAAGGSAGGGSAAGGSAAGGSAAGGSAAGGSAGGGSAGGGSAGGGSAGGGSAGGSASAYYTQSFEMCPGWTITGDWECGLISGGLDGGFGPPNAYDGTNAIGTRLNENYNNTDGGWDISLATSPEFSLAGATEPTLVFRAWVDTEGSTYDGFNVRASTDGMTYSLVSTVLPVYPLTVGGQSAWGGRLSAQGWQQYAANLTSLAGQATTSLRIAFRSDTSATFPGVWVDDVRVVEANTIPLSITTTALTNVLIPGSISATLARTGGSSAVTWSITGGTNNTWISIDPMTGALSGTPMMANLGPVTLTVRVTDASNSANFSERTFMFVVLQSPTVTSVPVTGLPTGFVPGWGVGLGPTGDVFFSVTNSTGLTSAGTQRGGIGSVPIAGGAYTPVYTENQSMSPVDPQVVFFSGGQLYAFNGLFSTVVGARGIYSITGLTAATEVMSAAAPFNSGSKYGWSASGSNFYIAQFTGAPYDILGGNVTASMSVPATNVTNLGTFSGPHGVAASATRLYVFDSNQIETYALDGAMAPSVPIVDPMVPVVNFALANPCQTGTRMLTALNSPMFPTKLYFAAWGSTTGSTSTPTNRICEVALDMNGYPTGPVSVTAGPTTTAVGSADGLANAATFQQMTGLYFDNVNSRLIILQRTNSVDATRLVRILAIP